MVLSIEPGGEFRRVFKVQQKADYFPSSQPSPQRKRDPHKIIRARTVPSPHRGEGQGEGENAALKVIPFTFMFLAFLSLQNP
jgi:hypothetical protein